MLESSHFFKHIKDWIVYSQQFLYTLPERPDLICFGVGSNGGGNSWGVQTHQKAIAAYITASYADSIDWSGTELSSEKVREQGLAMLRFSYESHLAGTHHLTDGKKWGHNWISTLGTARMMHAINAVWNELSEKDLEGLKKVFISEADWLLNEYPIKAGLVEDNKPESNIWNGAILYQVACLYPDAPNAKAYKEKATKFLINGISKEEDRYSDTVYDGIAVKDAFVGANMFDTMACNHHRYMNVGYMVICLSNLAMLYFWCRDRGYPLPEAFDHHVLEAWELIRNCTFEDGRLWRIGGDTRVRYCYCQDYALPMWALMAEKYNINCDSLVEGWLRQIDLEVENNGDGSFLSDRLKFMIETTPYYYARLEGDRAATLSMMGYWRKKYELHGEKETPLINKWYDKYHGSIMQKSKKCKASFTWLAGERPTAMLVPADESTLAEWQQNMTGVTRSFGAINKDTVLSHSEILFDGGFLTYGKSASESKRFGCEGYLFDTPSVKTIAYALLPDGETAISVQKAVSPNRIYMKSYAGLMLRIPNDLFNGNTRSYSSENGNFALKGGHFSEEKNIELGRWLNVDGKMGVVSSEGLTLKSPKMRQIYIVVDDTTDSNREGYGTLLCNDVVTKYNDKQEWFNPGDEVYTTAFAVSIGDAKETETLAKSFKKSDTGALVSASVTAKDGVCYTLTVNFGKNPETAALSEKYEIIAGEARLLPGEALLYKEV